MSAIYTIQLWIYPSSSPLGKEMSATNLNFLNGQKITRPDTSNDDLYHLHYEHLVFGKLRENCVYRYLCDDITS